MSSPLFAAGPAQHGTIDITGVKVTSWNGAGPDTDLTVPTGGTRGRAFVRAVSFMEGSTPRPSTMNIVDSDLGFLGYNAAESYGVSCKARGCGATTSTICDVLDVLGKQTGSTFHDNYIGTYTWGAKNMVFDHNVDTHNKSYVLCRVGCRPVDPLREQDHPGASRSTTGKGGRGCPSRRVAHGNRMTLWRAGPLRCRRMLSRSPPTKTPTRRHRARWRAQRGPNAPTRRTTWRRSDLEPPASPINAISSSRGSRGRVAGRCVI